MKLKYFRSPLLRTLITLGVLLTPNAALKACEVMVEGTSIFVRGGNLGGDGAWLEIKNAIKADGDMGENYQLAEYAWEAMGCYGY